MMEHIKYTVLFACLIILLTSCTKQEEDGPILKRDTDQLSFNYSESNKTFTIRTKGPWVIEMNETNWVNASLAEGTGDGINPQIVTLTANRNTGGQREGNILLKTGQNQATIKLKPLLNLDPETLQMEEY